MIFINYENFPIIKILSLLINYNFKSFKIEEKQIHRFKNQLNNIMIKLNNIFI